MFDTTPTISYQTIAFERGISVSIKRLDLVHPRIAGNKFFKLKYNFLAAQAQGKSHILSFGGAYSNHIHALAHAAHEYGFGSTGIIRGEELATQPLNPSLQEAAAMGMHLQFVSRPDYRRKHTADFLQALQQQFPHAYIVPEGGSNALAVQGCAEILSLSDQQQFDTVCVAVGTGGTIAGIANASADTQNILGFAALKGDFLSADIRQWTGKNNWQVLEDSVFGGYGRYNAELLDFVADMQQQHGLPLEPIYTGKAFYRLLQHIHNGSIATNSRILFVHTGGLQGWRGQDLG